jgi:hypothetical protein
MGRGSVHKRSNLAEGGYIEGAEPGLFRASTHHFVTSATITWVIPAAGDSCRRGRMVWKLELFGFPLVR